GAAGEGLKPVTGAEGTRIPLLRPGFRPSGPYAVSFVYLQPGAAFAKKGDATLALPRLDVPVNVLDWGLFLPDRYKVKATGGDLLPGAAPPCGALDAVAFTGMEAGDVGGVGGGDLGSVFGLRPLQRGDVAGVVQDPTGSPIPGALVTLTGSG